MRHISGTGGQLQFVRAGYASNGGKSFICMSSTYERGGVRRSRIVSELTSGNVVTAPRSDMMFVVTEYGLVNLKGKSIPERARAMNRPVRQLGSSACNDIGELTPPARFADAQRAPTPEDGSPFATGR
jgi:hypothetical protein